MEAVRHYKTLPSAQRVEEAKKIIKQYIGAGARTPINIPGTTIEKINTIVEDSTELRKTLFDVAVAQITDLLYAGEYQR